MNGLQKVVMITLLVVATVLAVSMYWSQHLTYKARDLEDTGQKVKLLEKAAKFWVLNDRAHYELGKAYFDYGYRNLEDVVEGKDNLQKSARSFVRSLRLNPGNFYGHYNYARGLFHLDYLSPSEDIDFIQEFKKSAILTGHRSEIYYEVGKIMLSRWEMLSEENQRFAIEILHKIAGRENREQFTGIMHAWEMNVGDYGVMRQILPDNPGLLRIYARFLGEKSLDKGERQNVLAIAERLEFQKAREEFSKGENHFRYYRPKEAEPFYENCLNILKNIKFYQGLTENGSIDETAFGDMRMMANLKLAQCGIQQGRGLDEVEGYLRAYLAMTDRVADASDLESYLVEKRLIGDKLEDSINELGLLSFHSFLYFKQNHYRDIKNIGKLLEESFVMVPEAGKQDYVDVLQWVANAHQITGYFYDATDFYLNALELDEDNVKILLGMRRNYERMNDDGGISRVDSRMERLLSSRELDFMDKTIAKGQRFVQPMLLDGSTVSLRLEFADIGKEDRIFPLVSVELNGQVVWEDYLGENTVTLLVESQEGENVLAIVPVNRPVRLTKIARR